MSDPLPWLVVFDLDDTLIAERDYQLSGISAVEQHLEALHQQPMQGVLLAAHRLGVTDLWGYACELLKLPSVVAHSLLWVYRLHLPQIGVQPGIANLLEHLAMKQVPLAVLSDGRSSTQRLKLQAAGLQHLPCFLSEEWGSCKPEPLRFQAIAARWPERRYLYVGDNPAKDFQAPSRLGWLCLGAAWTPDPIHPQHPSHADASVQQPHAWLHDPDQLLVWLR